MSKIDEIKDKIRKHTLLLSSSTSSSTSGNDDPSEPLLEKIVKLNVGGIIFTTSLKTLLSERDTFFIGFFSDHFLPQIQKVTNENGEECDVYFIDRNGKNFSLILDHLRGHKIGPKIVNLKGEDLFDLVEDVAFYQVRSIFPLLNDEGKELLKEHFSIELEEPLKKEEAVPPNTRLNLTTRALENIPPEHRRTVLGETLFPLVIELEPEYASMITGMLLDMETEQILRWIESEKEMKEIVAKAVDILKQNQY